MFVCVYRKFHDTDPWQAQVRGFCRRFGIQWALVWLFIRISNLVCNLQARDCHIALSNAAFFQILFQRSIAQWWQNCSHVSIVSRQFQACGTFKPFWYTSSDSGKSGQTGRLDNNCTFATHAAHRLTLRAFTGNQIGAWQRCTHCTRFTSPNVAWLPPILVRSQWVQEGLCEIVAAVLRRIWGLNSLWLEHWLLAWASLRLELASHSLRLECLSLLVDQLLPHQCSSNLALSQNVTKR